MKFQVAAGTLAVGLMVSVADGALAQPAPE